MKLSIITINFNNRGGLKKTIDSIISQSFKDFEWIVIDGASTDGSKELIEHYSEFISYWVSEPDKGIYNAMNKGIKVAKGEYLLFLNSGDWLCDDTSLERCFSHSFWADIIYGDLFFVDKNGNRDLYHYPQVLSLRFLYNYSLGHNATFIRRDIIQSCFYDESYEIVSDWAFFLKKALNNCSFEHISETVSCFDTTGISSEYAQLVQEERSIVINEVFPSVIIQDYKMMDEMEERLKNHQVQKVLEYGGKRKIFHKMITGLLLFIERIDK